MNAVDETLKRTGVKVMRLYLGWGACFVLLIIFAWVPFSTDGHAWQLGLPVVATALIYLLAKRLTHQIQALREGLPAEAEEELKRREIVCAQMQKKYAMILIPIMLLCCPIITLWGQHRLEQMERKADEQRAIRILEMRNAPARK